MGDRRVELTAWQREMITDVLERIKTTGAVLGLPKRATAEGVVRVALAGVFAKMGDLMDAYDVALAHSPETDPVLDTAVQPRSEDRGGDAHQLVRDEQGWLEFFRDCRVLVHDPRVGQEILKDALESMEGYRNLVKSMVEYQDVAVPLLEYPGIRLFGGTGDKVGDEPDVPKVTRKSGRGTVTRKVAEKGDNGGEEDDWEE